MLFGISVRQILGFIGLAFIVIGLILILGGDRLIGDREAWDERTPHGWFLVILGLGLIGQLALDLSAFGVAPVTVPPAN
jgi:hypothetical protein